MHGHLTDILGGQCAKKTLLKLDVSISTGRCCPCEGFCCLASFTGVGHPLVPLQKNDLC